VFVARGRGIATATGVTADCTLNFIYGLCLLLDFFTLFPSILLNLGLEFKIPPLKFADLLDIPPIVAQHSLELSVDFHILLILPAHLPAQILNLPLQLIILLNNGLNILYLISKIILQSIDLHRLLFEFLLYTVLMATEVLKLRYEFFRSV
jgi:hypothetical protein